MASKGSPLHGPRIKLIEKAQKLFAETKEHTFESKAAEEHAKLLRIQHELEVSTKQAIFVDSSISDTIRTCIVLGNHRAAMKVKTEFKVCETILCHLAENRNIKVTSLAPSIIVGGSIKRSIFSLMR
uniref:Vps16 C-terminal domain-containing protein n=1 Tax=Rhizophora mucronata TaxID=61149 RepID=A0A2P2L5I3_RHIMU